MIEAKQVVVMRMDLEMGKGKIAAQAAHACQGIFLRRTKHDKISDAEKVWHKTGTKIVVVRCGSEEELLEIFQKAKAAGLEVHMIKDSGLTELKKPELTCLAIGPDYAEKIDKITENLKLL